VGEAERRGGGGRERQVRLGESDGERAGGGEEAEGEMIWLVVWSIMNETHATDESDPTGTETLLEVGGELVTACGCPLRMGLK